MPPSFERDDSVCEDFIDYSDHMPILNTSMVDPNRSGFSEATSGSRTNVIHMVDLAAGDRRIHWRPQDGMLSLPSDERMQRRDYQQDAVYSRGARTRTYRFQQAHASASTSPGGLEHVLRLVACVSLRCLCSRHHALHLRLVRSVTPWLYWRTSSASPVPTRPLTNLSAHMSVAPYVTQSIISAHRVA